MPREQQRRFLQSEGWIAWSGPAIAELLKQFIAHNRMMSGGFSIHGDLVTLSDIDCPVLAVIGEVDDIGQPASVRGIKRAAPKADVYEFLIRAGHFGLVVGSKASTPDLACGRPVGQVDRQHRGYARRRHADAAAARGAQRKRRLVELASGPRHQRRHRDGRSAWPGRPPTRSSPPTSPRAQWLSRRVRTLPRLARLGQINDHTRISLGRLMSEQARDLPNGEALLFDGRVHTYEAVDRRVNNVVRGLIEVGVRQGAHVGVLMETRPSALVAIAALSRLGAVAVLMPPDADLAGRRPARARSPTSSPTRATSRRRASSTCGSWCSVVVSRATCTCPMTPRSSTWRRSTPTSSICPAGTGPIPGLARDLAFIGFTSIGGELSPGRSPTTAGHFRHSAPRRPPTSAAATRSTASPRCTINPGCWSRSAALWSADPASRLSRGLRPDRFIQEIRQYGVTVVTYTWAMLRDVIDDPSFSLTGSHPVRLFIGSGMPTGLWKRVVEVFEPAHVVEFFATTDGQAVLANVSGAKIGSKGRPLPGGGEVALAAYDPEDDLILEDERGFVRRADTNEVGVLLAHPRGPVDPTASVKRGVFAPADTWVSTEYLFRRDEDGDYWLVDNRGTVLHPFAPRCRLRVARE